MTSDAVKSSCGSIVSIRGVACRCVRRKEIGSGQRSRCRSERVLQSFESREEVEFVNDSERKWSTTNRRYRDSGLPSVSASLPRAIDRFIRNRTARIARAASEAPLPLRLVSIGIFYSFLFLHESNRIFRIFVSKKSRIVNDFRFLVNYIVLTWFKSGFSAKTTLILDCGWSFKRLPTTVPNNRAINLSTKRFWKCFFPEGI